MPTSSRTIHKRFEDSVVNIILIKNNFEAAYLAGNLSLEDIKQGYGGLFLELFTSFESLISTLFVGLANGSISHNSPLVSRIVTIKPPSLIEDVLIVDSKKGFIDWLPYESAVIPRGNLFFSLGKPFTNPTTAQKTTLLNYSIIRNAIAHKSSKANAKFNSYIATFMLSPSERDPLGFLRSIPNPAIGKTQFEIACEEILQFSRSLCY